MSMFCFRCHLTSLDEESQPSGSKAWGPRASSQRRTLGVLGDAGFTTIKHDRVLGDDLQIVHHRQQLAVVLAAEPRLDLRQRERQRHPSIVEKALYVVWTNRIIYALQNGRQALSTAISRVSNFNLNFILT